MVAREIPAAWTSVIEEGVSPRREEGMMAYCWNVEDAGVPIIPWKKTRVPGVRWVIEEPVEMIVPEASEPRIVGCSSVSY